MAKKSLFDDIVGMVKSKFVKAPSLETEGEVDNLWISEDRLQIKEKSVVKRNPRIETSILKERIQVKLTKLDSNSS